MKSSISTFLLLITLLLGGVLLVSGHGEDGESPDGTPIDVGDFHFDEVPTYYGSVKPILDTNCVGCHIEGQIGWDIPLTDVPFLTDISEDIARVVSVGYMPPWMPSEDNIPLKHERSLTNEEIATLIAWADNGTPMGDESEATTPVVTEVLSVRADMTLQLDGDSYTPGQANVNDYRCFIHELDLDEPMYLTGYVFEPDVAEMVHHGIVYRVSGDALSRARQKEADDGLPGYSCYGGVGLRGDDEFIGTWTPGTVPVFYPEGTGYLLSPDDIIIIQIHYWVGEVREPDRTSVRFQLEPDKGDILPLFTLEFTAPVEIPCPAEFADREECQRDVAIQTMREQYNNESIPPNSLLRQCDQTLADYADNTAERAVGSCAFEVPFPLISYGVLGHMHELGESFRIEVNPGTDDAKLLLDIPEWDFDWQDRYQFAEPFVFYPGDIVEMTCTWSNTVSENPRYVVWGEGTEEEMCFATFTLLEMPGLN